MRRFVPLLALACLGCFADRPRNTLDEHSVSGQRLRVVALVPESGGPALVDGMFDSELEVDCAYREASDGALRCFPTRSVRLHFGDASCETPVAHRSDICGRELVRVTHVDAADPGAPLRTTTTAYRVGEPQRLTRVYVETSLGCILDSEADGAVVALAPMPDERFVRGRLEVAPRDGDRRLGAVRIVGEDGSALFASYYDHAREQTCVPKLAAGPSPCLDGAVGIVARAGEGCDVPYAFGNGSGGAIPTWFVETGSSETDVCMVSEHVSVYRAGEPTVPSAFLECLGRSPPDPTFEAVPADNEVAWVDNAPLGTGRLGLRAASASRRPGNLFSGPFYDSVLGTDCGPYLVDGRTRCGPRRAPVLGTPLFFVDERCTERAAVVDGSASSCTPFRSELDSRGACEPVLQYFRVGQPLESVFALDVRGGCVRADPPSGASLHALLPLPAEELVAFDRVVR